jgi:non-canonical poly(A) RNA polymerase PAPD5/7
MRRLNLEIRKFYEYIRPSPIESVARKHVIEQVCQHVRNYLPGYVLEVFGSERTGLSFARSDIDLRLVPENRYRNSTEAHLPPTPEERFQMKGDLRKLHTRLLSRHKDSYLQPTVLWARYPLISMRDRASGLDIQIVLSNDTTLSRHFIQRYQEEYPFINEVYSVLKATLDVRGLSDVFKGGVGSYPLFMMLVACLKHRPSACNDAQSALLGFLAFWGTFKAQKHGISIEPPEFLANTSPVMSGAAMGNVEVSGPREWPVARH